MKKIIQYLAIAICAVFAVSCGDDYLKVSHYGLVSPDGIYSDADNVYGGLVGIYSTFYKDYNGAWPHPVICNSPSLDMQNEGWDAEMTTHSWGVEAKSGFFENLWGTMYKMIVRCNIYLSDLENVGEDVLPASTKKIYEAEARGLRGYSYYILTTNFSRVPMLMTGETYATSPEKASPESDDEAWATIIEDLEYAASVLDWRPYNNVLGHFTKASALAYAAKAHMYRGEFAQAKAQYKQIIDGSGKKLNPTHGMLHWMMNPDSEETIWEVTYPQLEKMDWGAGRFGSNNDMRFAPMQNKPDEYGGWGDSPVSYEYVRCFEPGDKRLMYNVQAWWGDHGDTHPYLGDKYTIGGRSARHRDYFQSTRSGIPNVHSIKWWKYDNVYLSHSVQLYRFTGVLLDYAECCFETGDNAEGWRVINQIRDRAWGNLEVGYDANVTNKGVSMFPFPNELLNTAKVDVPDAETYYTKYAKKQAGAYLGPSWESMGVPVWKVALLQERRKEFIQEFSFWPDICRMDLCKEWLDCEYPKNNNAHFYNTATKQFIVDNDADFNHAYKVASDADKANMIPVTYRDWDWNAIHRVYPIPTSELTANPLCTQNEGY